MTIKLLVRLPKPEDLSMDKQFIAFYTSSVLMSASHTIYIFETLINFNGLKESISIKAGKRGVEFTTEPKISLEILSGSVHL